jgi:hypothetical protein
MKEQDVDARHKAGYEEEARFATGAMRQVAGVS